jgi:limonene-1,2-epoxide hydrolase
VAAGVGACRRDDPVSAARAFLDAVQRQDHAAVYGALAAPGRRAVDDAVAAAPAVAGNPRAAAFQELFQQGAGRRVLAVELVRRDGDNAVVKLTDTNYQPQEVRLVKEDGTWRISLQP